MARVALIVLALVLVATPRDGRAGPVCVTPGHPGAGEGETLRELEALWPAVVRREGLDAPLVRVAAPSECPEDAGLRLLVVADEVHVVAPDGTVFARPLGDDAPWERARVIAAEAVETLRAGRLDVRTFVVDEPLPPVRVARWGVLAGGGYALHPTPGRHRGTVDLAAQVALWDEVLLVGLRVGWAPRQWLSGAPIDTRWTALDVGVHAMGGVPLGPVRLRAGVGVGACWSAIESRSWTRENDVTADEWRLALSAEAELEWSPWAPLRLALAVGGRFVPGATTWTWRGEPLASAPTAVGTAALRVGWWFD